jgi:AcrR family transcriptional regulator
MATKSSGPGRPSLSELRRRQIVDSFIALIADRGLDSVTMDDIAEAAGVQRAALRHYVGNRRDLLAVALDVLVLRFEQNLRLAVGPAPSFAHLVTHLFSSRWASRMRVEHRAFDVLAHEAARDPQMRSRVKNAYDLLIAEIAAALSRDCPGAPEARTRDCAYAITCVVEHHIEMSELGYGPAQSRAAKDAVRLLAAQIVDAAAAPMPADSYLVPNKRSPASPSPGTI